MPISIPSHGNPEKKVFGLIGQSITTDESAVYSKRDGDRLNIGWENVVPSQTPTNTATPTPTVSPTRTPTPTPVPSVALTTTPTVTPTPTPTVTVTVTPAVTSTPGGSPTATPTVTPTSSPPAGTPPATPTVTPTNTPTISVTPSSGAPPTPTPTVTSTVTNTPTPTVTSTPTTTPTSTPPTIWTLSVSSFAVNSGPSGQTPGGTGPTGGGSYNNGDTATVSITPDSNTDGTLYIDAVSIGQVAGTTSLSTGVTMNSNRSAQANWSWKNVQWNMGILGGGSGTATGPGGSAGPGNVQKLATISILATIDTGYRFVSWTCIEGGVTFGSTTSASTTATLTTDGAHSIRATILPLSYYIEGNRNDDGLLNFTYYDSDGNLQEYYNFDPGNPGGYVYPAACGTQVGTQIAGSANLSGIGC